MSTTNLGSNCSALDVVVLVEKLCDDLNIEPTDKRYVVKRLRAEGISFITKILPKYSTYALNCIEAKKILDARASGFTHFELKGNSPRFLAGLLRDAVLNKSAVSLRVIRQLCDFFYKMAFAMEERDLAKAEIDYVKTDAVAVVTDWDKAKRMRGLLHTLFPMVANTKFETVLKDSRPRDGGGSVADTGKHKAAHGFKPIQAIKRLSTSAIGSHLKKAESHKGLFRAFQARVRDLREVFNPIEEDRIAELAFVPKDSRGPRTISMEPMFHLRVQLAIGDWMAKTLIHESRGRINFSDQTVNQKLAKEASKDRKNVTADMEKASDRVLNELVQFLTRHTYAVREGCVKYRSTHVRLTNGRLHRLRKFANMGSGLCFPILSLTVYLSAVDDLVRMGIPLEEARMLVYTFGDDLIVPSWAYARVKKGLESVGLAVNLKKSFSTGNFRESCGGDYYYGVDVTPLRLKLSQAGLGPTSIYRDLVIPVMGMLPKKERCLGVYRGVDGQEVHYTKDRIFYEPERDNHLGLLELERFTRNCVDGGLYKTAAYFYNVIRKTVKLMPEVARTSNVMGIYDPDGVLQSNPGFKVDKPIAHGIKHSVYDCVVVVPTVESKSYDEVCELKALGAAANKNHSARKAPRAIEDIVVLSDADSGSRPDFHLITRRKKIELKVRVQSRTCLQPTETRVSSDFTLRSSGYSRTFQRIFMRKSRAEMHVIALESIANLLLATNADGEFNS